MAFGRQRRAETCCRPLRGNDKLSKVSWIEVGDAELACTRGGGSARDEIIGTRAARVMLVVRLIGRNCQLEGFN